MKTLACLHTSMVFINVETLINDLFAEILPGVRRINLIDDSLLADVMRAGHVTPATTKRLCALAEAAEAAGATAMLSLCSSVGLAVDVARQLTAIPIIKIDDAMTDEAVASASRIGVLATVASTLGPTLGLIQSKADLAHKSPQITPSLVDGAFEILMKGDRARHDELVSMAAQKLASQVEVIVCAQASMTRLAPRLAQETGCRVLTSPRLGIEYTRRVLESLPEMA